MRLFILIALAALGGCGSQSTWEPQSENVARYGSGTDESLLMVSLEEAVAAIVREHEPPPGTVVSIRVPHDPDGYAAAALLADALERDGRAVAWIPFDGVAAPSSRSVEVWEVATTIRGVVTKPSNDRPAYQREGLVEVRVMSLGSDAHLLSCAQGRGRCSCLVNMHFAERRVIPNER
jgi:hypothetical protein